MIDYLYAQERMKDMRREAAQRRLVKISVHSLRVQNHQKLANMFRRFRWIHAS